MYEVTMTSYLCFGRRNGLKAKNVILEFYDCFLTQWPKISPCTKLQLNISTNGWFFTFLWSQILQGTFCNFEAMATA